MHNRMLQLSAIESRQPLTSEQKFKHLCFHMHVFFDIRGSTRANGCLRTVILAQTDAY